MARGSPDEKAKQRKITNKHAESRAHIPTRIGLTTHSGCRSLEDIASDRDVEVQDQQQKSQIVAVGPGRLRHDGAVCMFCFEEYTRSRETEVGEKGRRAEKFLKTARGGPISRYQSRRLRSLTGMRSSSTRSQASQLPAQTSLLTHCLETESVRKEEASQGCPSIGMT